MNLPRLLHLFLIVLIFLSLSLLPGYATGAEKESQSADPIRQGGIYRRGSIWGDGRTADL
ncbi:hypothetical protein LCGC14_1973480 [marine sediment metagenome]|uniref:Uncharacterized protein n=1 Tax=marine sediment metagenome TaxID=412755 RepID=A0A0F9FAZ1_9ZZZZ